MPGVKDHIEKHARAVLPRRAVKQKREKAYLMAHNSFENVTSLHARLQALHAERQDLEATLANLTAGIDGDDLLVHRL